MNIKNIFPNAIIGQDIEGAYFVYDRNREVMGFVSGDVFHLNADYTHRDAALERLLKNNINIEKWVNENDRSRTR